MDYILTFEDGSDAYLSHHGVKGMKWGVRKNKYDQGANSPGRGLSDATKRKLKTAAIGVGAAAAVGGGVYLARKAGLGKANKSYAQTVTKAKKNLDSTRKGISSHMKAEREKFANDWVRDVRSIGSNTNSRNANIHVAQSVRGLRSGNAKAHPSMKTAMEMDKHLQIYEGAKKRYASQIKNAKSTLNGRKRVINIMTGVGAAGAIGAGTGAAYAYNRKSNKRR